MNSLLPIVFFSNSQERGGAEEHILTLLNGLPRERFCFHFVCPPAVARAVERDLPDDVEIAEIDFSRPRQVDAAAQLFKFLKARKASVLHSHLFYASIFASPVGKAARVPVVIETPHVREQWRKGWKANYRIDRFAGKFVDQYIAVSAANKKYLVEEKGLPAQKITVILNGSDLNKFTNIPRSNDLRIAHQIGLSDLLVLVPARLAPQKGHSVLIEAASEIVKNFPSVRFVCVGDGDLKPNLIAQAKRCGVEGNFKWVGFQKNMPEWYAASDLVVLPSFFEGLPLAMIEALASERPVVATSVDGTPEIVLHERTGLLVSPGQPQDLANAINRLLGDPDLRRKFGQAGFRWVHDNFSDKKQIRATEQLYLSLLEKKCPSLLSGFKNESSEAKSVMQA
jgi:glycosyltransferase involved in cell wall biosynthesis